MNKPRPNHKIREISKAYWIENSSRNQHTGKLLDDYKLQATAKIIYNNLIAEVFFILSYNQQFYLSK